MARPSRGKWTKYKILRGSSKLASALPATRRLTQDDLWDYVGKYGKVIVKPSSGSGGAGVMQVASKSGGTYAVHYGRKIVAKTGKKSAFSYVKKQTKSRYYVVQRRISLARVGGSPFDLRVMVQRKKGASWKVTGRLAKVAGKGYIVTNIARSKGKVLPVSTAIKRSSSSLSYGSLSPRINSIALHAAKRLAKHYAGLRKVGFDMGIDKHGKVWIIEDNFNPALSLFLKLKDKQMYRTIKKYN